MGFTVDWQSERWGSLRFWGFWGISVMEGPGGNGQQLFPFPFDNVAPFEFYEHERGLTVIGHSDLSDWCVRTEVFIVDEAVQGMVASRVGCDDPFAQPPSQPPELNPVRHEGMDGYFALQHRCVDELCANLVWEQSSREVDRTVIWSHTVARAQGLVSVESFGWQEIGFHRPSVVAYGPGLSQSRTAELLSYRVLEVSQPSCALAWDHNGIRSLELSLFSRVARLVPAARSDATCSGTFGVRDYLADEPRQLAPHHK
jgi:hypothetical protein